MVTSLDSYVAIRDLNKLRYDDALDVLGIHGMSGLWGALATGLFAAPFVNELGTGLFYGNPGQLITKIIAVVVVAAYSFIATLLIGKVIDIVIGLRGEE